MSELQRFIDGGYQVGTARRRILTVSGREIMEKKFNPRFEAVQGLVSEGVTLLCGSPKVGKSWLTLSLCCAVAAGAHFLGRETTQAEVLYCAFEDSERRLADRLRVLGVPVPDGLHLFTEPVTLAEDLLGALDEFLQASPGVRLIVVDTLQTVRGDSFSRSPYADDYAVIRRFKTFAEERHVAVVLVHHLRKKRRDDEGADPAERISGTNGLAGAADATLVLTRAHGSPDGLLSTAGRDISSDDIELRFCAGRWTTADAETRARERYKSQPIVKALRAYVAQPSFSSSFTVALDDLREWCGDHGYFVGATVKDFARDLERLGPQLALYDGLHAVFGKRAGTRRAVLLHKGV